MPVYRRSSACRAVSALSFACLLAIAGAVDAQWKPTKHVEIVVGTAAGGPLDITARLVQKLIETRTPGVTAVVVNRTGGGHAIAMAYLNQFAGNGHHLAMSTPNLITNRLTASNPINYTDVTPLALLNQEYVALSVRSDSAVKTGRDLIERMRANPGALSFAIGFRSGNQHLAAASVLSAAGIDVKQVRFVSFKGGAETVPAVLGGHVDVLVATPTSTLKHVESGQLRMLGVTAPQRLSGEMTSVPTWIEQGVNATSANWRGVVGPRGLTAPQIAYWDQFFGDMLQSAEWQEAARRYQWDGPSLASADTLKFLQEEERKLGSLLKEMGDAK